ncbi:MAG: ATP-dependent DNA helicase [Candidatus Dormiibacterota bacterium]
MTGIALPDAPPTAALDEEQRVAVEHGDGPCLVIAGPGSGKTRIIVERFHRLSALGVGAGRQLVLTYTRKAADEMRARVERAHGSFGDDAPLTNYHSFGLRVVREWGWLLGISPVLRIADAAERWLHAEAVLDELRPPLLWNPLRPHDLMDPLLEVIGTAKQELVTPDAYATWAAARLEGCDDPAERIVLERHQDVARLYARLDERYRRAGVFDFDDCILYAERLIREHPAVRSAVADRISHVMVDEYQDTNYAQAKLVETLVAGHRNLFVVADDDQSIYKFRGASRANLDRFGREYPEHRQLVLTHNYRSTDQIVAASRALIGVASPATRIEKRLIADRGPGAAVEVWRAPEERSEAMAVARECARLIASGMRPADIAWLFRQHVDMQPAMRALRQCGVPYQVAGGRGFFQEREVKDALALLAAVDDPDDSQAVLRCLTLPGWGVTTAGRVALVRASHQHDVPLVVLVADAAVEDLDAVDLAAAQRCVQDIQELHAASQREDVRDLFQLALEASGFLGIIDEQSGVARLQMGANLNKLGELLETFADWSDDRRVSTALRYLGVLRDSRDGGELPSIEAIEDGVVLLTAHGSKGLEWPVVFLSRCTERRWQGRTTSSSDLQLPDDLVPEPPPPGDVAVDEERRLFYVASTRARDRLVYTWARSYPQPSSEESCTPFLTMAMSLRGGSVLSKELPADSTIAVRAPRPAGAPVLQRLSIAVSDLGVFRSCPRRYNYLRRWHLPVRPDARSWYGTMIHEVLRSAATRRIAGEAVSGDVVASMWHAAWDQSRGPKGRHAELRAHGEEQLRRYLESPGWIDTTIDQVEEPVTISLDHADAAGRFDRVDRRLDGIPTVVDYKTGRPKEETALRSDLQLRAYAVGLAQREQTDAVAVEFHYLQGAVTRVVADKGFLRKAHGHLSATARELALASSTGSFPPKPSRWQCQRCDFRTVCDEGRAAARDE